MNILILEDDTSLLQGVTLKLTKEGHSVYGAGSIAGAMNQPFSFDIAILDINLPDGSGLEVCRNLRSKSPKIYIILLTVNDSETDIVMGYDMGADDYVTKPFSLSVLLSKINAVKRRLEGKSEKYPLSFDPAAHTVKLDGETVYLTRNETRLLEKLISRPGQIYTKEQLIQCLWGIDGEFVDDNALAVNIQRLRVKLGNGKAVHIENIRGVGYRLNI